MKSKTLVSISAAVIWLAAASFVYAADPSLGTWKLNVAKSKFTPGPAPKSGTVTYEAVGDAVKRTGEQIAADGKKSRFTYTAKFDGKYYPVTGSDLYDEISDQEDQTIITPRRHDEKGWERVRTCETERSKDGKSDDNHDNGHECQGREVN